jgi:hypothetical protein
MSNQAYRRSLTSLLQGNPGKEAGIRLPIFLTGREGLTIAESYILMRSGGHGEPRPR